METTLLVFAIGYIVFWLILIIHANQWYWGLPKAVRKRLNEEDMDW